MQTYEINLWLDKKIVEKVVKQFKDDDEVLEYIKNNFDTEPEPNYPQLDPTRGYVRPKADDHIITWSKISTYVRKTAPKRIELTDKEKELQATLEQSITKESIDEWGNNEMMRQVCKNYGPNPNAKGYSEFPGRENKTYDKK
jgi:hypothetical protein|tara:strand:+ start:90 stop:515 length:426 start_codon:yes stop_codon:yes gene_type:complete